MADDKTGEFQDKLEQELADDFGEDIGTEQNTPEVSVSENPEIAKLQQQLIEAVQKAEQAHQLYLKSEADKQNIRRRAEEQVSKAHKFGIEKFAEALLSVVDNLERGYEASQAEAADFESIRQGTAMTIEEFNRVFTKFGIEVIDPKGESFDPSIHEAMSMVPSPEAEPNTVLEVYQKGYLIHGRLLRPARVVVAKSA